MGGLLEEVTESSNPAALTASSNFVSTSSAPQMSDRTSPFFFQPIRVGWRQS